MVTIEPSLVNQKQRTRRTCSDSPLFPIAAACSSCSFTTLTAEQRHGGDRGCSRQQARVILHVFHQAGAPVAAQEPGGKFREDLGPRSGGAVWREGGREGGGCARLCCCWYGQGKVKKRVRA